MADVTIASGVVVSTNTARAIRTTVFISDLVGYYFYCSSNGMAAKKTTDGGATWPTQYDVNAVDNQLAVAFDVWYDRWTPGDTGTLIRYAWYDTVNDIVRSAAWNTATDAIQIGTNTDIFVGASAVAGRGAFISITKARSGDLYCAYDLDAGAERGFHRSTDGGVSWSANLSTTFVEATLDTCKLYPASNTGDDNDCWALYYDASALALTLKLWDNSAVAQVESATIGVAHTDGATDLTGQFGYDGAMRHSDGHLIVAALSARDVAASTHQVFDITDTSTITTKTAIAASTDDHYYPQVFIDQSTNAIYVAYNGKRDGSEVLDTTTKVYYCKSTDGGTTWSAGDTAYMEGAAGVVQQVWTPLSGLRFYAVWRSGTTLLGNAVNSVSTPSGPAAQGVTGVTIASTAQRFAPTVVPQAVTVTAATVAVGSSVTAPDVSAGTVAQDVTGTTLAVGSSVTAPTVVPGAVTVTGATLTSGSVVRVPTITPDAVTVTGATVTSGLQVRVPSISPGAVTVTGATLTSSVQVRVPSVTTDAVTITGATVTSGLQLFAPTVMGTGAVVGATVASSLHLFAPVVTGGAVPVGVVSNVPIFWLV